MRSIKLVLMIVALSVSTLAQQPTPARGKTPQNPAVLTASPEQQKLHASAMKFMEASDARQRLSQGLDKLLEEGRLSMMQKSPGLDPRFGEEWLKRMHQRVNPDDFVNATARVYERYFTAAELEELTKGQLALKKAQVYSLPPQLADKMKVDSAFIQRDINTETSVVGARVGTEVGKELEKEHPEWLKPAPAPAPLAKK